MKKCMFILWVTVLCLAGCGASDPGLPEAEGVDRAAVLLTVDGRGVTAGTYLYWLSGVCSALEEQYAREGKPLDWGQATEAGTLGDYAKNQALRSAALYATVENWAERYGCALTAADRAALEAQWAERAEAHGGEAAWLKLLAQKGLDRAEARRMAEDHYLYVALCALAETPGSPLYAAAEELAAWSGERGYLTVRVLELSGEERAGRAAEIFAQLNHSADPGGVFDELGAAPARTLPAGDGTLEEAVSAAAAALEPGQFSGILETAAGYALVLRLETDHSALRPAHFDHRLQEAADQAEVRTAPAYEALDVAPFRARAFQTLEK